MAIYFGDELRSSNSDYPIIDLSENTSKGVIFVDALGDVVDPNDPTAIHPDLVNKVFPGVLLVNKATGKVYIFTAQDDPVQAAKIIDISDGSSAHWKNVGDTPIFDSNLYVNIGEGRTFGKYDNNDELPWNGKTALDALKDALTKYQDFLSTDISFDSGVAETFQYSTQDRDNQTAALTFKLRNRNRNTITGNNTATVNSGIKRIQISKGGSVLGYVDRNVGNTAWTYGGIFNSTNTLIFDAVGKTNITNAIQALNSFTATPDDYVSVSFSDIDVDIPAYTGNGGDFYQNYTIEVIAIEDDGSAQAAVSLTADNDTSGSYKVNGYLQPTVTFTAARSTPSNIAASETGNLSRIMGDIGSNISFTVVNQAASQDSLIQISEVQVWRKYTSLNGTSQTILEKIHGQGGSGENAIDPNQNDTLQSYTGDYSFEDGVTTTGSENDPIAESDVIEVTYEVRIVDNGTGVDANTVSLQQPSIEFKVPYFVGYSDVNPVNVSGATLASALQSLFLTDFNATIGGSTNELNIEYVNMTKLTAFNTTSDMNDLYDTYEPLLPPEDKYIYIGFPIEFSNPLHSFNSITDGATTITNDFVDDGLDSRGTSAINVLFENSVTVPYKVYASSGAGDGNGQPYVKLVIS